MVPSLLGKGATAPTGTLFSARGGSNGTTLYHFGIQTAKSNYGLHVYDTAGDLVFDAVSWAKTVRPVGELSGSILTSDTSSQSATYKSGRTYAAWLCTPVSAFRIRDISLGNGTYSYFMDDQNMTVAISGATVTVTATRQNATQPIGSGFTPYSSAGQPFWRAIILDVTGY